MLHHKLNVSPSLRLTFNYCGDDRRKLWSCLYTKLGAVNLLVHMEKNEAAAAIGVHR